MFTVNHCHFLNGNRICGREIDACKDCRFHRRTVVLTDRSEEDGVLATGGENKTAFPNRPLVAREPDTRPAPDSDDWSGYEILGMPGRSVQGVPSHAPTTLPPKASLASRHIVNIRVEGLIGREAGEIVDIRPRARSRQAALLAPI